MGCISTQENAMQGCLIEYLGSMKYHLIAAPDFATLYFPNGLTIDNVRRAPTLFFNRNDELPRKLLSQALEEVPVSILINYVPSVEKHTGFIVSGLAASNGKDIPINDCLQEMFISAPDGMTVGEMRSTCSKNNTQTTQLNASEKERGGVVNQRVQIDKENILKPFTLMAHNQNYILAAHNFSGYSNEEYDEGYREVVQVTIILILPITSVMER